MGHKNKDLAIGVDIGGTNIKMGLIDRGGRLVELLSLPLKRRPDGIADLSFVTSAVKRFIAKHQVFKRVLGVGVASPGFLNASEGVVDYAVNLGWENVRIAESIEEQLKLPVRLVSDAVAGAIGERYYGAGADCSAFLYVCIGTGVGASLFADGRFYRGASGGAVNIGHIGIFHDGKSCECGNVGCLEKYVSAPAITKRVEEEWGKADTSLRDLDRLKALDPMHIFDAARGGDAYAREVFREAGQILGIGLVTCLHLFGVETVIVGGGISQAGDYLLDSARETVAARFGNAGRRTATIVPAAHPTTAGVLGAGANIFHSVI